MRNFFEAQKIIFNFNFRHLKRHICLSKDFRHFRRYIKHNFCKDSQKIILKYHFLINWRMSYILSKKGLVENIYISLYSVYIDLQKKPDCYSIRKKILQIENDLKCLKENEGIDLP